MCISLTEKQALGALAATTWSLPTISGSLVLTKAWTTHPSLTSRRVGVFIFKRLVTHKCTGTNPTFCKKGTTVADVHKVAYCIKCHYDVFPSTLASSVTDEHRKAFVTKCIPMAIDNQGNIKPGSRCTGDDLTRAGASIAGF